MALFALVCVLVVCVFVCVVLVCLFLCFRCLRSSLCFTFLFVCLTVTLFRGHVLLYLFLLNYRTDTNQLFIC